MSTQTQIDANRLNAQKSTGPKTPEGKAASSQNAMKSGLYSDQPYIPGESKEAFAQLQAEYTEEFRPATVAERFQVDKLIRNEWLLRRFARIEDELLAAQFRDSENTMTGCELGQLFQQHNRIYMRLERRMRNAEKAHKEAMNELLKLKDLSTQHPAPSTTGAPAEGAGLASFRQPPIDVHAMMAEMEDFIQRGHQRLREEGILTDVPEAFDPEKF